MRVRRRIKDDVARGRDAGRWGSWIVVGLRRAGFAASQLRTLKEAYRLLLRSGLSLAEALERLTALGDPLADELGAFVRDSKRGFHRASRETDLA